MIWIFFLGLIAMMFFKPKTAWVLVPLSVLILLAI
jgi:hypothetical protein